MTETDYGMQLIEEIEQLSIVTGERRLRIRRTREYISDTEDAVTIEVEKEWEDSDGKNKSLSNATKRKIETKKRLTYDMDYMQAVDDLHDMESLQVMDEAKLGSKSRLFDLLYRYE